jgi:hypothetical protein
MYEITCSECGDIGFHASRIGAESRAERHSDETDHETTVGPMESA